MAIGKAMRKWRAKKRAIRKVPKAIKTYVKSAITKSEETKFIDETVANATYDYTGTIAQFCTIPVYTGNAALADNSRIGDEATLTYSQTRFYISGNSASTQNWQNVRIIIFYGRNENGTNPTVANTLAMNGGPNVVQTFYKYDYKDNFKVLYDKMHTVDAGSQSVTGQRGPGANIVKKISINLNHKHHKMKMMDGLGTIQNGGLWVLICSDVTANLPGVAYFTRHFFKDS